MSLTLKAIASLINEGVIRNCVVLTGAGVSCASGIPDFRSPGGMYDTLRPQMLTATEEQRQYLAADPTGVVDIRLFTQNQFPYLELRRPFILGSFEQKWLPTVAHFFNRVLHDKGLLRRVYTQNIDGLDHQVGLPDSRIVNVHGTLTKVECESCKVKPINLSLQPLNISSFIFLLLSSRSVSSLIISKHHLLFTRLVSCHLFQLAFFP